MTKTGQIEIRSQVFVWNIGEFEAGDPPAGWGVRRTNFEFVSDFDIRISDLRSCSMPKVRPEVGLEI